MQLKKIAAGVTFGVMLAAGGGGLWVPRPVGLTV